MTKALDLTFDRVTYRDGQRLTARDLRDDHTRETRLRQLHTRYLHETWGIATGFDVQAVGVSSVAVGPGYALDHLDRELVSAASIVIPVPDAAGPQTFVLVITFQPDCVFGSRAGVDAVCFDSPLDPRRDKPAFAWRTMANLDIGPMVPLCSLVVQNNAIQGGIDTRVRRYARRLVRPHCATGITDVDDGGWDTWWNAGIRIGFKRQVSTADAGFTSAPLYFPQLVVTRPPSDHTSDELAQAIAQAHGHIADMSLDSFEYRLILEEPFTVDLRKTCAVSWLGVEPLAGCPPTLQLRHLFTLSGWQLSVRALGALRLHL